MKTSEVIEGCKTLAEFMGENEAHASIGFIYPRDECFPLSGRKFKESAIEDEVAREVEEFGGTLSVATSNYNNDWNLLMPVVEKIQATSCDSIESDKLWERVMEALIQVNIMLIFYACVSFAKWYKNQPK